ncbi:hypothetical protein SALB1_3480 [Salinisphaera sp. LB1]|nr:hypothetical protein SALB1_3480 [Salinisphaera sp. LB1]
MGPAFQRRISTASPEKFSGSITLNRAQYVTFRDFYKTTLAQGVLPFTWKHPITGDSAVIRFDVSNAPSMSALSNDLFKVSMNLEVMP